MSLLSWLFPKAKRPEPPSRPVPSAGAPGPRSASAAPPAAPVDERMQRREQLYGVVRDVMVRAGVLSAGYKFKVLSLDQRGAQFLVMVDMAPEYADEPMHGAETEALIVETARVRCDILVTAVYWRINPQLGRSQSGRGIAPGALAAPARAAVGASSRPAPLLRSAPPIDAPTSRPTPLVARVGAGGRFEPIEADEVAAFKQALASAAAARPATVPGAQGTRSGPLLPPSPSGFEDTVMPGQEGHRANLSSTQYGDL